MNRKLSIHHILLCKAIEQEETTLVKLPSVPTSVIKCYIYIYVIIYLEIAGKSKISSLVM